MRLRPSELAAGYGSGRGDPLLDAELVEGPAGQAGERELWHLAGELTLAGGRVAYDQRLTRHSDGSYRLHAQGAGLRIDPEERRLTLEAEGESLARQLVTTYGIPLLLVQSPALTLHAGAAIPPGGQKAIVVCGSSGTGKSSLIAGLISAGWTALTEDLCVVDLRSDTPVVWPGPPWVRMQGEGPPRSRPRFETADKTAWDIEPWQSPQPVAVELVVFMERAGGEGLLWEPLDKGESIARLGRMTSWLGESEERASATFASCVKIGATTPAARMRLPVSSDWVSSAESTLRDRRPAS